MTREEFNRPFTEAELQAKFEKVGLDEITWDYCKESYIEAHKEFVDEYCSNGNDGDIDELIADLKAEENWVVDTVREYSWQYVLADNKPSIYETQRKKGHGHTWSMIYTEETEFSAIHNSYDPLKETYIKLYAIDKAEAHREREIFIDSLPESKNLIFKKALTQSFGQGQTIGEDIEFARGVAYQYDQLQKSGCQPNEIYNYAKNLAEDRYDIYYRAYRTAINNEASSRVAYNFANKIEELYVNGYLPLETESFCNEFKETWQREFYYTLEKEYVAQNGERWSVLDKNRLRTMLGLTSIDEPLTVEDKEISADRKAHEAVYERKESSLKLRLMSESEWIKQDMGHILYTNEEDYQDYLDGEI